MIKTAKNVRIGDIATLLDPTTRRPVARTIRNVAFVNGNVELTTSAGVQVVTPNSTLEVAEPV
jgi:hypothetical protein